MEGKVPWWRRVLDFALRGIRSGIRWLGNSGAPGTEFELERRLAEPEAAATGEIVEVMEPGGVAIDVDPVEVAAPAKIETEVIHLGIVAGEVENQEEENALKDSSDQFEEIPAEQFSAEEGTKNEPATEPADPEQPVAQARMPAEPEAPAMEAESLTEPPAAPALETSSGGEPVQQSLPLPERTQEQKTAEKVAAALKARGQDAEQSPFSVIVSEVYDGPLDLLLDLIRKQDIDIYDIPIARITAQFLTYVDRLRASDMDVAGEFIYTAALLIHIKSRMLLPRAPAGPDDAGEDPRRELVERLLEHERFKNAAQMLHEKQMLEAASWTNPGVREFREDEGAEPEIAADTTDLVRIFREILDRARNRPILDVQEDTVTVGQMIQFLARRLTIEDKPVALRRLLSHTKSERALIAMFLALLELVRLQAILLRQDRHFSEIFIKKHTGFESVMNQGLAEARDDWR